MFLEAKPRETLRFEGNKIYCFPRDQSLSDLLYSWKFRSWKFIKLGCNGGKILLVQKTGLEHESKQLCLILYNDVNATGAVIGRCP